MDYEKYDLKNKTIIITGSNAGLGKEIAKKIAKLNGHIIFACRNEKKAMEAIKEVKDFTNNENEKLEFIKLDLLSFESIKEFANEIKRRELQINILINNAGIMWLWEDLKWNNPITKIGCSQFNTQFFANYLGHFMLTQLLFDNLMENQARILNISSSVHSLSNFSLENLTENTSYTFATYCQSKMAQILSTYQMHSQIESIESEKKATVNAVHPGIFASDIVNLPSPLDKLYFKIFKSAEYCARHIVKYAVYDEYQSISGKYFDDTKIIKTSKQSYDTNLSKQLWDKSMELIKDYIM
ncbi:hypothetical protein DICPUDRAFT_78961 [Dictyostelium purpureum]|uniref:Uncharacterized protein n=1 Tax=Dictyostelium purpureum TaxID=5786 RepID=F0ZL50_DICPU|nr:uncharacterized protein DICPUDRAFT_78961 [Dictyostelium purpureum]EGC35345.1 hypothetical protein DICPUDRAFT_78961 [Dictyostelium purpureum]|eukprot:XP_003288152.1 hypothetical protein DICPUDRAFT_78961 [Dictyostelium purpureum]